VNIRTLIPLLATSLTMLGCAAKALDLDAPVIEPSTEPDVLGTLPELMTKLVVDDERLYWAGWGPTRLVLQSCQKQDCAATLVTYDAQSNALASLFSVRGGHVYWYRDGTGELVSCPIAGCNGSPRIVATNLTRETAGSFYLGSGAFDGDDRFYFTDLTQTGGTTIFSISLTQPSPRQPIASSSRAGALVGVDSAYAYLFTAEDEQHRAGLSRAHKDGSSAVETIATDVKRAYSVGFAFATDQTAIYWTNNVLAGSINRCPIAGCTGASEIVTGPVRAPQNLLIDDSNLYYVYEEQSGQLALATCELPACAQSTPVPLPEGLFRPELLALDDQYLYMVTSKLDWFSLHGETGVSGNIRRLPKPHRGQQ